MIDTDVHQEAVSIQDLIPWVDPGIRDYIVSSNFSIPGALFPNPHHYVRRDAMPEDGTTDAAYDLLKRQLLDPLDIDYAIVNGGAATNLLSCMAHTQVAGAIAQAWNRWLVNDWLPRDHRLKGSLVVATQDPVQAATEIRAAGDNPDIVQVLLICGAEAGYGNQRYHPIYEAAIEMGLHIAIHPGGEGNGINPPPSAGCGYPTYYIEYHTLLPTAAMAHTVSLICHGVFEKYPDLRVVITEGGIVWLPEIMWRLDENWKSLRSEVPWVKRLPSEILYEHMRFTTQPLEQPASGGQLRQLLEAVGRLDEVLMFSSDYPHWDTDSPTLVAKRLPPSWQEQVLSENARTLYGFAQREKSAD